ncbi:MAG TPA: hypothetical protein VNL71_20955 [Chloroflexota bacterium]|nr:hypothetical protein [Chloroflexota bacterium]
MEGRYGDAADGYREALGLIADSGDQPLIASRLEELARIAADREQPHRAAGPFGAAAGLRDTSGASLPADERIAFEAAAARVRDTLGDPAWEEYRRAGRALPLAQAIAVARARDEPI